MIAQSTGCRSNVSNSKPIGKTSVRILPEYNPVLAGISVQAFVILQPSGLNSKQPLPDLSPIRTDKTFSHARADYLLRDKDNRLRAEFSAKAEITA
jgi:hypothetical protein